MFFPILGRFADSKIFWMKQVRTEVVVVYTTHYAKMVMLVWKNIFFFLKAFNEMPDYICFLFRIQITKLNNGLKQTDFLCESVVSSANDVQWICYFKFFPHSFISFLGTNNPHTHPHTIFTVRKTYYDFAESNWCRCTVLEEHGRRAACNTKVIPLNTHQVIYHYVGQNLSWNRSQIVRLHTCLRYKSNLALNSLL